MFDWPFNASSTYEVQGFGFWLAILGLVISLVGFAVTLGQLSRTKKATEAVSDEIKNIQFAVFKFNAVAETSRAEGFLLAARKYVKDRDWDQANDALDSFSKSLFTIRELQVPEISSHYEKLGKAMVHANRLCERLDSSSPPGLPDVETPKTLSILRDHDRLITSIRVALDRSNIGE
ncbi:MULTISPECIES: hypothetical protein [unclassified Novosphingobium]|uniref:hypothetical protein n=1 Tax=unclassified Novosphingobium TaxID=2644732 RepID=UPI001359FC6E|nr:MULTISPECIES: hypothetical protein [unclassified Novosphingobium]